MLCDWDSLLALLPLWMRNSVDKQGRERLQELCLRVGAPPQLRLGDGVASIYGVVSRDDLLFCINMASRYSPWTASTAAQCYITAKGGHRLGICGQAIIDNGIMMGIRDPTSICIRVARDFQGISGNLQKVTGPTLIIGKPGSGKTTLLRDLIRCRSKWEKICVVDERQELFPLDRSGFLFDPGIQTDVLSGAGKYHGIQAVLRSMGPECIAVDEITQYEDCEALVKAAWCGVKLLATAHAASREDLLRRSVYRPILETGIFQSLIILQADKSFVMENLDDSC